MKVEITPTEKIEVLMENLENRLENAEIKDGKIVAEAEKQEKLDLIPGIESYRIKGKQHKGLGGSPVDEQAYARLESKKDAAVALVATIMGYDLRILDTDREWDYRRLKRYNPDMKQLKAEEPKEVLGIENAVFESDKLEEIEIDLDRDEAMEVYRKMLA